jgi:hypothetical protein
MTLVTQAVFDKVSGDLEDIANLLTDDVPNREQVTDLLMEMAQAGATFAGLDGLPTQDRLKVVGAALLKIGTAMVESAVVQEGT